MGTPNFFFSDAPESLQDALFAGSLLVPPRPLVLSGSVDWHSFVRSFEQAHRLEPWTFQC